eukprot:9476010-Pyramimonas_sp.AAC.2
MKSLKCPNVSSEMSKCALRTSKCPNVPSEPRNVQMCPPNIPPGGLCATTSAHARGRHGRASSAQHSGEN